MVTICKESGKVRHLSRGAAEAHLRGLRKKDGCDQPRHVYPCIACAGWHVGRARKKEHQNRYSKKEVKRWMS